MLPCAAGADRYMGIGDVGCSARREQPANICRVYPAEVDHVSCRLANQARQPDLLIRPPDCLGQRSGRNGDPGTCFTCPGKEDDYTAVVSVEGDQAARVEGNARHQAADLPPRCVTPSTSSAQARSLSESAPPVSCSASASNAPQPATSSKETPTACCTKPETG